MTPQLEELLAQAREISWSHFGPYLEIYTPGMFVAYGQRGHYPAVSLTGPQCSLSCQHCAGKLLETMLPATTPQELVRLGKERWAKGDKGLLLSGGSDPQGRLPWPKMLPAIARLAAETDLILTAHVGRIDAGTARALKEAGVRQALLDVVGDADTAREILCQPWGLTAQEQTLDACAQAGLELVPHLILGLHGGAWRGEERALEIVADYRPQRLVFVVFMPLKGTPLQDATPVQAESAAEFMARARLKLPDIKHHLGCARPRGRYRQHLDALAVAGGINALALPSDGALEMARDLGVKVSYHDTCCSLA